MPNTGILGSVIQARDGTFWFALSPPWWKRGEIRVARVKGIGQWGMVVK
jgi:hypothetical protein